MFEWLFGRTEAQEVRKQRIDRANEDLNRHREDLARISWGSNAERRISQVERDETLQVIRNKRISLRALERTWEGLIEGFELEEKSSVAEPSIKLLREALRR